jgi:hypothetical protein
MQPQGISHSREKVVAAIVLAVPSARKESSSSVSKQGEKIKKDKWKLCTSRGCATQAIN